MDKKNLWPGWETVKLIGRGSFGTVYEIQRNVFGDIEKAALKVISIPQNESDISALYDDGYDEESITSTFKSHLQSIIAEYSLMRKLNGCANIVNCEDVRYVRHEDGIGWDIFIKMELLTPLAKTLPAEIPEETVVKIAKDMCNALILCKEHGIIHRDIKPQNIFLSPHGDYKLGDFGIAKTVEQTMGGTKTGTYNYMAPEVYNNKPYGASADIYSLGLVLYWLLNERRTPFLPLPPEKLKADMDKQARERRFSGEQIPPPAHGSDALKYVVLKACAFDPNNRYSTAAEMLADLNALAKMPIPPQPMPEPGPIPAPEPPKPDPKPEPNPESQKENIIEKLLNNKSFVFSACAVIIILIALLFTGKANSSAASKNMAVANNSMSPQASTANEHTHSWIDATCTTPKTCYTCGEVSGTAKGHQWLDATYDAPKTCAVCGETEGTVLEDTSKLKVPTVGMVAAGNYHSLHLYPDGSVYAVGRKTLAENENKGTRLDVSGWTDIVAISASSHTVGLRSNGTVVACGPNGSGQCDLSGWTDIIAIATGDYHTVGLRSDGRVIARGKNEHGQCDVSGWRDIVAIAASENETYGLKADGTIVSAGRYTYGSGWRNLVSIAGGTFDIYGVKDDGTVVGAGNNSNWSNNTISYWNDIVQISASSTHVVGLRSDGTVVACGRGSAAEACDVGYWDDIVQVSAGMNFTLGLKSDGTIVAIGENIEGQCNIS